MESFLELGINAAMVALLSATILYCWLLNKRIQTLQDSRSELANLLKQFDRSTRRATDAMNTLQKASKEAGKSVQARIEKAQYVLDDLSYMIDRANKVADQMEAGIAIARQREKIDVKPAEQQAPTTVTPPPPPAEPAPTESLVLEDFQEKEEMIISGVTRDSIRQSLRQAKAGGKGSSSALSSIQSLLETVAERNQELLSEAESAPAEPRSRGEKELLKALQMQAE